jgi:hypothetical protein
MLISTHFDLVVGRAGSCAQTRAARALQLYDMSICEVQSCRVNRAGTFDQILVPPLHKFLNHKYVVIERRMNCLFITAGG